MIDISERLEYDPLTEDIEELNRQLGENSDSLHTNEMENIENTQISLEDENMKEDYNAAINDFLDAACEKYKINELMYQCLWDILYMKESPLDKQQDLKNIILEIPILIKETKTVNKVLNFISIEAMKNITKSTDEYNSRLFVKILKNVDFLLDKVFKNLLVSEESEETCDNEILQTESAINDKYALPNSIKSSNIESDSDSVCFLEEVENSAASCRKESCSNDVIEIIEEENLQNENAFDNNYSSTSNTIQRESVYNEHLSRSCRKENLQNENVFDDNLPSTSNAMQRESVSKEHLSRSCGKQRYRIKRNYLIVVPKKSKSRERMSSRSAQQSSENYYILPPQAELECNDFRDRRELKRADFNNERIRNYKRRLQLIQEDSSTDREKEYRDYNYRKRKCLLRENDRGTSRRHYSSSKRLGKNSHFENAEKVAHRNHKEKGFESASDEFKFLKLLDTATKLSSSVLIPLLLPKIEKIKLETEEDIHLYENLGKKILALVMDAKFKRLPTMK